VNIFEKQKEDTKTVKKKKILGQTEWLTAVILATQGVDIKRTAVGGQPWPKFMRHHLNQWLGMVEFTCHHRYWGINRRIVVQVSPVKNGRPY
jgi:hypothetical protein